MQKFIVRLDRFNEFSTRYAGYAATLLLGCMLTIMVLHVFFRYVLGSSFVWTEELSRYMMIWMAFLFFPAAHRQGLNASLELAVNWFKHTMPWRLLQLVLEVCILVVVFWCIKLGFGLIERGATTQSLSLGISMSFVYSILPLSFGLTALCSIERVLRLGLILFYPNASLTGHKLHNNDNTRV
ncbi:TRAP transporter small permease [Vreelandella aquamarina]